MLFTSKAPLAIAAIAAGSLVGMPPAAEAGDPVQCGIYANQAVQQQAANLQNQCGFVGLRWLSDAGAHLAWCLGATTAQINAERNARNVMLASCLGGGGSPPPPGQFTFNEPKIGGWRLDWCKSWAAQCGAPAAHAYCQTKGYSHAASFALASNIGAFAPTKVITTGQVCNGPECDGFAWITCAN